MRMMKTQVFLQRASNQRGLLDGNLRCCPKPPADESRLCSLINEQEFLSQICSLCMGCVCVWGVGSVARQNVSNF